MAYSVRSAAKALDLSVRVVWDLVAKGEIDSFKIGASRRITREALVAYIERKSAERAADETHPPAGPNTPPPPSGPGKAERVA